MSDHDGIALLPIPGHRTEHTIRKWAALGVASWLALCALVAAIRWLIERTTAAVESVTDVAPSLPMLVGVLVAGRLAFALGRKRQRGADTFRFFRSRAR